MKDILITSEFLLLRRKKDREDRATERKTSSIPLCICGYGRYLERSEVCERCKKPALRLAA